MQPNDIYRLPSLSDPHLSPDGTQVAFVVTTADEPSNSHRSCIWLVPVDGSAPPRRLTAGDKNDTSPRWSPDGHRLAFVSNRDGASQLYVLELAGGEPTRLTQSATGVSSPAWSPDGRSLAFTADVLGEGAGDGETEPLSRHLTTLSYKADGQGWRLGIWVHVFVVPANGAGPARQLTSGDIDHTEPAWSPDGTRLVVTASHPDGPELCRAMDVVVLDVATGAREVLTNGDQVFMKPVWSPDGTRLAARSYPDIETSPRHSQIVVIDVASRAAASWTKALDRQCGPYFVPRAPIWLDGDRIAFANDWHGRTPVWTIDETGATAHLLEGDRLIADFDIVGDVMVHMQTTVTRPIELFCGERQLTSFTDDFCAIADLVDLEEFWAPSTGGAEVQAWLMKPPGAKPGEKFPTLVFIHGGPFTQYGVGFFDEFQVATGAGFAVLFSNPRGSTGYPEEWGRAIRGPIAGGPGWGTVDADDVLAVVDTAVERFDCIDRERIGVLGGSYGGFLSAWLVGQSDRFKAACPERGIYNLLSAIGTSDELWSSQSVWGGNPYEHQDEIMKASPITYVHNVNVPVLIVHSERDLRCPMEQAEQYFAALRLGKKDAQLLRFTEGTHELSRAGRPAQRVERFEKIMGFFQEKL